ncbi:MAG: helix-turn-helix domain-containing protein [Oscillospiraceae bacterium]|nr:helix-turn-helix domain-containing protein [Oscillospiraceae bacterium]
MDEKFVRDRITQLRLKKGVSEYQMGFDLGHSRGYIYNISSGKSLPPFKEFFAVCEYFGITPADFFDEEDNNPIMIKQALDGMKKLSDEDLALVLKFIERLGK